MAKKSMIGRYQKVKSMVERYASKRRELKIIIKKSTNDNEVAEAQLKLEKLPVKSCSTRLNSRCTQCGRPRGVYKKFKLCRICLRQQLMTGNVPGGRKSSW